MLKSLNTLLIFSVTIILCSCDFITVKVFSKKIQISGKVDSLIGKINPANSSGMLNTRGIVGGCSEDAIAQLYEVSEDGKIDRTKLLAKSIVSSNSTYSFNIDKKNLTNKDNFQVEITGCEESYFEKRIITDFDSKQDVFLESTFITDVLNNSLYDIRQIGLNNLKKLTIQLQDNDKSLIEKEQIITEFLGDNLADVYKKIRPEVFIIFDGTIAKEGEPKIIKSFLHHPDSTFSAITNWKIDGVSYGTGPNITYTPSKNSSGQREIELEVTTNYSVGLNQKKILKIQILNNFPIVSPTFNIQSDSLINNYVLSTNVNVDIHHVDSCETYSNFTLSDNEIIPHAGDFIYACSDNLISYDLLNVKNGENRIFLWVRDNAGNISKSSISYFYDEINPSVNLSLSKNKIKGGDIISIESTFSDNESGIKNAKLSYSEDNFLTETVLANNLTSSGSLNWTAPIINKNFQFKLFVTDNVNNAHFTIVNLEIDSQAPASSVLNLLSSASSNNPNIDVELSGCSVGNSYLILNTKSSLTPSSPSGGHSDWKQCTNAIINSSFIASGDGVNSIYSWLKDDVGNISIISNKLTAYVDQTAPQFLQAPTIGDGVIPGSVHEISWIVYDANQPIKLSYRLCDGLGCDPYLVSNIDESLITIAQKKVTAPVVEKNGLYLEYSATDIFGNSTSGKSYFNVDFTPPTIVSVVANNGSKFSTTSMVPLLIDIDDEGNFLGIKVHIEIIELISEADYASTLCPNSISNPKWFDWRENQAVMLALDMKEGAKKLCVFAKDGANNVSTSKEALVVYEKLNPPSVKEFYVYKKDLSNPSNKTQYNYTTGDTVTIEWAIHDLEGFGSHDTALSYSFDGLTWLDVDSNKDILDPANVTWLTSNTVDQQNRKGSYTQFKAPACKNNSAPNCQQFFRIKIFTKDRSETFSSSVISAAQNTGIWSIFAGTEDRGIGGQALSASLKMSGNLFQNLVKIDQATGNMYLLDVTYGLRKYDVKTGVISTLFEIDLNKNLEISGTFTDTFRAKAHASMNVLPLNDTQVLLFLRDYETYLGYLYFVDYQTKTYRRILGGSTGRDLSNPLSFAISEQILERDENGLIYIMQPCYASTFHWTTGHYEVIRMKMSTDFTFSQREVVVGNCDSTTFNYSLGMNSEDFVTKYQYSSMTEFKVINSNYFYLGLQARPYYKIVNKKVYQSAMVAPSYPNLAFDKKNNILYTKNSAQGIKRYKINPLDGVSNEVDQDTNEYVKSLASGYLSNCKDNGIHKDSACVLAMDMVVGTNSELYFVDGALLNSEANYILKTINQDNLLMNVAGTLSFYGDGLNKNLIRGRIGGIHYNQEEYGQITKGLYLSSPNMVFGRIGEDNIYHTLFGNQIFLDMNIGNDISISPSVTMGAAYAGGEGFPIAFDDEYIYIRLMRKIGRIDKNLKFSFMQNYNASTQWDLLNESTDIRTSNLSPYATYQNLIVKDNRFIFSGAYIVFDSVTYDSRVPQVSLFDFNTNLKTYLTGYGSTFVQRKSFSDYLSAEPLRTTPFSYGCASANCVNYYDKNTDRLYILAREDGKIRYFTNPFLTNGPVQTKGIVPNIELKADYIFSSVYNLNFSNIANMIISEDSSQMFYTTTKGLYCVPLTPSGERGWCNNENLYPYEKELGGFLVGANSMTWKDNQTLLISNFKDKILQFDLPN